MGGDRRLLHLRSKMGNMKGEFRGAPGTLILYAILVSMVSSVNGISDPSEGNETCTQLPHFGFSVSHHLCRAIKSSCWMFSKHREACRVPDSGRSNAVTLVQNPWLKQHRKK